MQLLGLDSRAENAFVLADSTVSGNHAIGGDTSSTGYFIGPSARQGGIRLLNGPTLVATGPLHQVLTILGSDPGCDIRLSDSSVSRYHCGLLQTQVGAWVVDLLSREGTRVNDHRVRWVPLAPGDHLQVGAFKFEIDGDPAGPVTPTSPSGMSILNGTYEVVAPAKSSRPISSPRRLRLSTARTTVAFLVPFLVLMFFLATGELGR